MDIFLDLEYPLPKISTSVEKIFIESNKSFEGNFSVKNIGGSQLLGNINSNSKFISLSSNEFLGNEINVDFFVDLTSFKPGDFLEASFLISSNGGEKIIDIEIKITPPILYTKMGRKIFSLKDFCEFSKENPTEARFIFSSQEFMLWLFDLGYKNLEIFEELIKDPNKERALDNFFRLNKLKSKSTITAKQKELKIFLDNFQKDIFSIQILFEKKGFGFAKTNMTIKNSSPWIIMDLKELSSSDFENKNMKEIDLYINPKYIKSKVVSDKIILDESLEEIIITVKKKPLFKINTSKKSFKFEDTGKILFENNYGKDVVFEVIPKDNFIKFKGKKYFIGKKSEITFDVKFSGLKKTQLLIKNQPVYKTVIFLRAVVDEKIYTKKLNIDIGSLY